MPGGPDLHALFDHLYRAYGAQHWWPAESPFEVMVGAVLTQNTAWGNVEKALANLKRANAFEPATIAAMPETELANLLRPAGYFNVKARRLHSYCRWYLARGGYAVLVGEPLHRLRQQLLEVQGVGPETADDILLYAFDRPVFVIDAYTRRVLGRLGHAYSEARYEALRAQIEEELPSDARLYNEYHALLVRHGKEVCRKSPRCDACALAALCPWHAMAEGGARCARRALAG
jgi:endonuclease-3 related protein